MVHTFALLAVIPLLWVLAASGMAYAAFKIDKSRAVAGQWRIPERALLLLALLGGSPGAKLAQVHLRHKTRKQPFKRLLNSIIVVQFLTLGVATVGLAKQMPTIRVMATDFLASKSAPAAKPILPPVNRGVTKASP